MHAVLAEESLTRLCSNTESTMDAKDPPCHHAHNRTFNSTILNNNCFIAKWFVCMRTNFENGIANEAIVLLWLVWTASWDFKVVKKQWAGALLSVNDADLCEKKFEEEEDFLVQYFRRRRRRRRRRRLSGSILSKKKKKKKKTTFWFNTFEEEEEEEDDDFLVQYFRRRRRRRRRLSGSILLKKKKKKKKTTFWFDTFTMLFHASGHVVCHENTWRWTVHCYKVYRFKILSNFFVLSCIACPCYPYIYRVYWLYNKITFTIITMVNVFSWTLKDSFIVLYITY